MGLPDAPASRASLAKLAVCVMVELREREIDALIGRAGLPPDNRADHAAIRKALYGFFDDHLR
jgi:hypothetical protein